MSSKQTDFFQNDSTDHSCLPYTLFQYVSNTLHIKTVLIIRVKILFMHMPIIFCKTSGTYLFIAHRGIVIAVDSRLNLEKNLSNYSSLLKISNVWINKKKEKNDSQTCFEIPPRRKHLDVISYLIISVGSLHILRIYLRKSTE